MRAHVTQPEFRSHAEGPARSPDAVPLSEPQPNGLGSFSHSPLAGRSQLEALTTSSRTSFSLSLTLSFACMGGASGRDAVAGL